MPRTTETASFQFNHTMIRVRDPDVSVKFYTEILGMDLLSKNNMGDYTLYFLAFDQGQNYKDISEEEKDKAKFAREGVLELTHNHGTETDASFAGYSSGNSDPGRGFGHIAITVNDVEEACARFETLGVQFKKRPQDGKMRHIAFILDPDGYWIEVVPSSLKL
ncbi:Glyoxalase/Bleomycin resistance protein/Dihydroxybiphenyl dioxygenase [Lentinula aciculospora]|uniref:Lactoylglutathione lyase n=1 Tax=Lentinula aciculospora TaxID=153920 RepID=A0A9W9AWL1_9AGAR|nr:Glyoxalase/Bleomycin resistance protein/Dihydroxybiphenyl dioxygenase [Lentinula aciculospora]